jgi:tripartite motif-containing protein 71
LYVGDSYNHRIQLFPYGQLNATTVAGNGAVGTVTLSYPLAVMLDIKGYLYIVDNGNHRIVGSGPNGFHCIAGCSGTTGSANNQLSFPWSFSFERYGNIFVNDQGNSRIQKFLISSNSCSK